MRAALIRLLFYPTLAWNLLLARLCPGRRWWDRIDDHVILGALPFAADVPRLHAEGVRAVVNACAETAGPVEAYARAGIEQLRLPLPDFTAPPLEAVRAAVAFIQARAARGETVYVHCKAGRGRGATFVLCWLISRGLRPEAAQALLREKRPHVRRRLDRRPVVRAYAGEPGTGAAS